MISKGDTPFNCCGMGGVILAAAAAADDALPADGAFLRAPLTRGGLPREEGALADTGEVTTMMLRDGGDGEMEIEWRDGG